jgi:hypothetical protein
MNQGITIRVKRGVKVNVVEGDNLSEGDSRIPSDREIVVEAPSAVKLAITELTADKHATAKAAVMLRCG